jgi:hypothetical protein
MRTTVNLEPEAIAKARLLSRQRGVPLGAIISELILKATESSSTKEVRNGVEIFPRRADAAPGLADVNELRD